jgi:predicted CXXCH cytochrome family protein
MVKKTLLALAIAYSATALGAITDTKHNLSSTGDSSNNTFASAGEVCVFCHTPHGSDASAAVPIWNRIMRTNTVYTTYAELGTSTLDAQQARIGSVSLACLSCHDGSQALDSVINAPGSGGYNKAGARFGGSATAGSGNNPIDTGTGKFTSDGVANLGVDLRNDHPVSVVYAGSQDGTLAAADPDFHSATKEIGAPNKYYVESNESAGRDKNDMILYVRSSFTAWDGAGFNTSVNTETAFVECATCHDPHTDVTTFLRMPEGNNTSQICLTCHIK